LRSNQINFFNHQHQSSKQTPIRNNVTTLQKTINLTNIRFNSFSNEKNNNNNQNNNSSSSTDDKFMEENVRQMQDLFKQVSAELKKRQQIQDERDRIQDEKEMRELKEKQEKEGILIDDDDFDPNDPKQRMNTQQQEHLEEDEEQDILGGSKLEDDFNFEEMFRKMRMNPDKSVLETQSDFTKEELDYYFELFEKKPEELMRQMSELNSETKERIVLDYINEKMDLSQVAQDYLPSDMSKIKEIAKNLNNLAEQDKLDSFSDLEKLINTQLNQQQGLPTDTQNNSPVDLEEIGEITDMSPEEMEEQFKEIEKKFAAMDAELEREDEYLTQQEREMINDESLSDPQLEMELQKFIARKYPAKKTKKLTEFRIKEDVRAKKAVEADVQQQKEENSKLPK